jgi:hypothetical protein
MPQMLIDGHEWSLNARVWGLDKMSERELRATHKAFDLWRNPSNATLKLRNAVVFRPRSNCHRCKDNFWFILAVLDSRKFVDDKWDIGYSWAPQWDLREYHLEQLAMAKLFCDWDYLEPIVSLIYDPGRVETIVSCKNGEMIKAVLGSNQFQETFAKYQENLSCDTYTINDQDTGTDIIESLRGRILDPATPARDIAALSKELSKRVADRRRLFPHLGF